MIQSAVVKSHLPLTKIVKYLSLQCRKKVKSKNYMRVDLHRSYLSNADSDRFSDHKSFNGFEYFNG